jgi:23S rRNA pseudouridine2605 synthase
LEIDADGVLLMTNDGDLADKLTHPRYGVEKVFRVEVKGQVSAEDLVKIRKGMWLSEGRTPSARVNVTYSAREMTVMEITMRESKHRAIPRMLSRLGYKPKKLSCIRIGRLTVRGMRSGEYRALTVDEVRQLRKLAIRSLEVGEAGAIEKQGEPARQGAERPTRGRGGKPARARPGAGRGRSQGRPGRAAGKRRGEG